MRDIFVQIVCAIGVLAGFGCIGTGLLGLGGVWGTHERLNWVGLVFVGVVSVSTGLAVWLLR